jgi:hypothetical protein
MKGRFIATAMKTCLYLHSSLILIAVLLGTPASGSPIYGTTLITEDFATTGLGTASTDQVNSTATLSTVLTGSGSTPACANANNCATTSYSVSDQVAHVSLSFSSSATCMTSPCGPSANGLYPYAEANFNGSINSVSDGIQVGTVPSGSGLLGLQYVMQGTIGGSGAPAGSGYGAISVDLGDLSNPDTLSFAVELGPLGPSVQPQELNNGSTVLSSFTPDSSLANTWDYTVVGVFFLPVSSGLQDALSIDEVGTADEYAGPAYNPSMWFSITDDPQIGGALFYDSTGTSLLSGVTLTSASGFDYTQPIPTSATPEPAQVLITSVGLAVMVILRKRLTL